MDMSMANGVGEPSGLLASRRDKVLRLMDMLVEALDEVSQVNTEVAEKFSRQLETFMKTLTELRREVHGDILKLGADLRVEDPSRLSFLKADVSVQKLAFIEESLQMILDGEILRDDGAVGKATGDQLAAKDEPMNPA
mmetsp:Transcript_10092/g.42406  ORF Transcript_10092/g.42406 Transcript_10092/m.42406 type:complete len:138 (-) Transcript_10092:533-946(-)|eukprot:CAMPEP_0113954574 /NCGR_PEP_ID=MMETSP0011_2-20120614/656_1 /TAXON_ID=101924 /ORGANISM="Rhodosorus marinus" /LENGTH=137 /DNA_ID=CAMNT_0000963773 /DNA_START=72 /DNA_END=485 /DNA_ORIENTATION=- /assembly_acc=CAM_ASM_000156